MIIPVPSGGIGKAYAAISVTYPSGSVCTCSNGTKTFTAKDTSGKWLFLLPSGGNWTVRSQDGLDYAAETVTVTERSAAYMVALVYTIYMVRNGVRNAAIEYHTINATIEEASGFFNLKSNANNIRTLLWFDVTLTKDSILYFDAADMRSFYSSSEVPRPSIFAGVKTPSATSLGTTNYAFLANTDTPISNVIKTLPIPAETTQVGVAIAGEATFAAYANIRNMYIE